MLLLIVIIVMMMVMLVLVLVLIVVIIHDFRKDLRLKVGSALDRLEDLRAVKLCDGRRDDRRFLVVLTKDLNALRDLRIIYLVGPCEDDGPRIFDLVDEELAEILDVELALGGVHYCDRAVERHVGAFRRVLHRLHDIREFSDAGGLDEDPLRRIFVHDFPEGCAEVAHQRAADASGIHLADLDPGFLEETAVDTDLTEFILDQNDAGACQGVLEELLDQGSLSGSEKAGNNINFRHYIASFLLAISSYKRTVF